MAHPINRVAVIGSGTMGGALAAHFANAGIAVYLLHGVSYSGMWLAGVAFANRLAPPGLGATAQGLFNAVFNGLGFFGGSIFGGLLYDRYGGANLFFWCGLLALLALFLFLLIRSKD